MNGELLGWAVINFGLFLYNTQFDKPAFDKLVGLLGLGATGILVWQAFS